MSIPNIRQNRLKRHFFASNRPQNLPNQHFPLEPSFLPPYFSTQTTVHLFKNHWQQSSVYDIITKSIGQTALKDAQNITVLPTLEKYPRGRRGSPAKGVVRVNRSQGSNPCFSASKSSTLKRVLFCCRFAGFPCLARGNDVAEPYHRQADTSLFKILIVC